jgi:AcrR family transcriptional regulator
LLSLYRLDGTVGIVLPETSKNKILDAAEAVALEAGVPHLTLDAIAAKVGMSKGGVLYHYPSKDALVKGMVARMIEQTETEIERLAGLDPEPKGRLMRAYLRVTFPEEGACSTRVNQLCAVLLTAILTNPELLEPARQHYAETLKRLIAENGKPETVHLIRLAADGLWLSEMLQFPGPQGPERSALLKLLFEMSRK